MLPMLTGVISTTRNVKIQLDADASAAALWRIASGAYSAGTTSRLDLRNNNNQDGTQIEERSEDLRNQGIASKPTAKKKLNANSMIDATIPAEVEPSDTVPARIAIQQPCPAAANSISFRRPSLSMIQIGMSELRK